MFSFETVLVACGFRYFYTLKSNISSLSNYLKRVQVPIDLASHPRLISNVNVTVENARPLPNNHKCKDLLYVALSWIYTGLVAGALCLNPIHEIINENYPSMCYGLIPVVQFIFGVIYHSTSHFEQWRMDGTYTISDNKLVLYSGITGIVQSIAILCTYINDLDTILWYRFISTAFGILITSVFSVEMWFVFFKHLKVITKFSKSFNSDIEMNELVQSLAKIKYDLEISIGAFKNNLGVTTLIGVIPFGYAILCIRDVNCPSNFPWGGIGLFCMYQLVIFFIVKYIDSKKDEIHRISRHPVFIKKFVSRSSAHSLAELYNNDIAMVVVNIAEDNASSIDSQIFSDIASSDWNQFRVM